MFTQFDVLETIDMVEREHLDIRTITMGLSLFSCVRSTRRRRRKTFTISYAAARKRS